jgi:hypothetical protein
MQEMGIPKQAATRARCTKKREHQQNNWERVERTQTTLAENEITIAASLPRLPASI